MNPVLATIHNRRSVRSYQSRPVPREALETLIEAATWAPSGMNTQPWRFVVVESPEMKARLVATAVPNSIRYLEPLRESNPGRFAMIMRRYAELPDPVYYSAPAIVFVIGSGAYAGDSCPMACLNLMLAAHSLGLGTCWVKLGSLVTDNPEIVAALGLGEDETIFGPILVGYAEDIPGVALRKHPRISWV